MFDLFSLIAERDVLVLTFTMVGVMDPGFVSAFGRKLKWVDGVGMVLY